VLVLSLSNIKTYFWPSLDGIEIHIEVPSVDDEKLKGKASRQSVNFTAHVSS